jgi:DNA-directed RNA polymerase subunit RPC12/RpoP
MAAQVMSIDLAMATAKRYVCARCWHDLIVTHHDGQDWIECSNSARCDGQGYVTRRYAEKRKEQDPADLMDARWNIGKIINPQPKKCEKQILAELGF